MTEQPYEFIEIEDEPSGTTMTDAFDSEDDQDGEAVQQGPPTDHGPPDTVSLEEIYPNDSDGSVEDTELTIKDMDIDADELAEELEEASDPSPTLLESIIGFFRGLVR